MVKPTGYATAKNYPMLAALPLSDRQKHQQPAAVGVFLRLRKKVVPLHHKTPTARRRWCFFAFTEKSSTFAP